MSTKALIAYKRAGKPYVCKYSHYGAPSDYEDEYYGNDFDEYVETVLRGDSTEPFDGYYLDYDHCRSMGWNDEQIIEMMQKSCPKVAETLKDLFDIGTKHGVDMIFVKHDDESLNIYDFNGYEFVEYVTTLMPFNVENSDDFDLDEIKEEMHRTMEQVDEMCGDASDIIVDYNLQEEQIDGLDRKGAKDWMIRFNAALPEFQRRSL